MNFSTKQTWGMQIMKMQYENDYARYEYADMKWLMNTAVFETHNLMASTTQQRNIILMKGYRMGCIYEWNTKGNISHN